MLAISSKLPQVTTNIFTVMSQWAATHQAVNLGQGFPDFAMSEELIQLVHQAMKMGMNQYTHMFGLQQLREQIADKAAQLYGSNLHPDTQITITPGATYAIYTALTSIVHPGDEVIVFEPGYDSYIPNIIINGGVPVLIPLQYPNYNIPWDVVRQKINPKTRVIIINSPHNPTGSVLSAADMQQLETIVTHTNIIVLSDEVYEHIIFDNIEHQSVLHYPNLLKRSFVCFSFGKTYHCTGWKVGYCIAGPELMHEFKNVHQFNSFSSNTPMQFALAQYLKNKTAYRSLGSFIQSKRDYFNQLMHDTPFKPIPSYGSYFQCYSYEGYSDEPDRDFALRLTRDYGVATIPVSAFYRNGKDDKVIRFCFAKKEETLLQAVEKLRRM